MSNPAESFRVDRGSGPKILQLGKFLGGGGFGDVYQLLGHHRGNVVKIYQNPAVAIENERKIDWMISLGEPMPPFLHRGRCYPQLAWPIAKVYDEKKFRGFMMPEINEAETIDLDWIMTQDNRKKKNIIENWHFRLHVARNLALVLCNLHSKGVCVIDLKGENIKLNRNHGFVCLIDCDGFLSADKSQRMTAGSTEGYRLPERGHSGEAADFREEQDRFALAVVIFEMLNNNIHPFGGFFRNGREHNSDKQSQIDAGLYPFGLRPHPEFAPQNGAYLEWLDDGTRRLFDRSFIRGYSRPSAKEWADHLANLDARIIKCKKNPKNHVHFDKGCFQCAHDEWGRKLKLGQNPPWPRPIHDRAGAMPQAAWASVNPRSTPHANFLVGSFNYLAKIRSKLSAIIPWFVSSVIFGLILGAIWHVLEIVLVDVETNPTDAAIEGKTIAEGRLGTEDRLVSINDLLVAVQRFSRIEIERALAVAQRGDAKEIQAAALQAGRGFDFTPYSVSRDNARATRLNTQALAKFNTEGDILGAYKLQLAAFEANPFNSEVAGNLAIYAQSLSRLDEALSAVSLALALPRPPDKTGRTADWATLAAIYAKQGDIDRATDALYVTLGMASDVSARCYSAIYSTINVYGDPLRPATERMIERVHAQGLSRAPACRLPIDWTAPPSQIKFEPTSKLTINGMNPVRLGFTSDQFEGVFGRSLEALECIQRPDGRLRECAIRDNFLGDVRGSLIIDRVDGVGDRVVGISINDASVSTPSQVQIGSSADDVVEAYGRKFVLDKASDTLIRLPGIEKDVDFELRFELHDRQVTSMSAVISSAYSSKQPEEVAATENNWGVIMPKMPAFSVDQPFFKQMDEKAYTSPRLSLPEGANPRNYTFSIRVLGGSVDVNVIATRGEFSYNSSERGVKLCQLGAWKSIQISNASAQSIEVKLKKVRSPCD